MALNVRILLQKTIYHAYSIWTFTLSDLKTIIAPSLAFGLLTATSASSFGIEPPPSRSDVLRRAPCIVFWAWINLLPFTIDNQRQPTAIAEDSFNKPWRPIPSKRMTPSQAKSLMLAVYPVALLASLSIGGIKQCIALIFLGFWYNDGEGGDKSCIIRNFINACGFICYTSGAVEIALGRHYPPSDLLVKWFLLIGAIVFTTVQTQDMCDQSGDSCRGRRTVPLTVGDSVGRWMTAVPMTFWCLFCPWYWRVPAWGWIPAVFFGMVVSLRTLTRRTVQEDKLTFKIWNLWLVLLYSLPLIKSSWG